MSSAGPTAAPLQGVVFNIQKFSLHDGPGLRTTVFLKGCPLRCRWCSNPEGLEPTPQLSYRESLCIGVQECGRCIGACPEGAIRLAPSSGRAAVDFERCTDCSACVAACPAKALETSGIPMSVDEVMRRVEQDGTFYRRSGGGLTLSGGECAMQPEFAAALLQQARARGLTTAIETSGHAKWEHLERIALLADTVHYDIKHMDPSRHAEGTGVRNELILKNFRRLGALLPAGRIVVRTPVVPGFNDTVEDIAAIARFVKSVSEDIVYELLPYHRLGEAKYRCLGIEYPAAQIDAQGAQAQAQDYRRLVELARSARVLVPLTERQGPPLLPRLRAVELHAQT